MCEFHLTIKKMYYKQMKFRIFAIAVVSVFITGVQAQTNKKDSATVKQPVYRFEAGYTQTNRYGDYVSTTPFHGIRLGVNVEYPLQYGFGVETGLRYTYSFGKKVQYYTKSDTVNYTYTGHAIDIPVRLTYTLPIFWGLKIFGYAGPDFNIGLAQTSKVTVSDLPIITGFPIDIKSGTYNLYKTELNRFSVMLGAGGGIQWKDFRVKGGYEWGLNSISKDKKSPEKLKGWYAAFEYEF